MVNGSLVSAGHQEMRDIAVLGSTLVAVGIHHSGEADDRTGWDAAVWVSSDGANWTRVRDEPSLEVAGYQAMYGVVAGGPGFVAVGFDDREGGDSDAAVWTSPDGWRWTRVGHDESVFGGPDMQTLSAVASGPLGVVAVGEDGWRAAVWFSPDGLTWSRVPHDEDLFGGPADPGFADVAWVGDRFVAVGSAASSGSRVAAVWISSDGVIWNRVPHDEEAFGIIPRNMTAIASFDGGLVAVGSDADARAVVWTSQDGGMTWSRISDSDFGGLNPYGGRSEMYGVVALHGGAIAVGRSEGLDWDSEAAVWGSDDGLWWRRLAVFVAPGDQRANAVTLFGGGAIAVGSDSSGREVDAAVWICTEAA